MQSQRPYSALGRNPQEDLQKFSAQISRVGEEAALGTGILVTKDGLIATCYHVIKSVIKSRSGGASNKRYVTVSFSKGAIRLKAEILEHYCNEHLDVAILKIDKIPEECDEAKLGVRIYDYFGHHFVSRGYRKNERYSHLPSDGIISDIVYSKDWSSDVIRLESSNYGETGMSGSAVYDVDLNSPLVVGMMRFHDEDEKGVDDKAPYAIPISDVIKCCPEIEKKNRGLLVYEFLNMIESFDYESYKDIDHLWVPPKEYDDIIRILESKRLVIITGPPEYGKTYTAIRILWEYYRKGYIAKLVEVENVGVEETVFRKTISEILNVVSQKKNIILYLKDPFGKTRFIDNYVEEVKTLLSKLKTYKNAMLIITSRETNYGQIDNDLFFREIKSVIRFDITRPSFDPEKVLRMHAKNIGCAWIKDRKTTNTILSLLKGNDDNLFFQKHHSFIPTLLNIVNFVQQTSNEKAKDIGKLKKKMIAISEGTPRAFAKEIEAEHHDLMEFLSFPFISDRFNTKFVKAQFEELVKDKQYSERYHFEKVAELFKYKISTEKCVRFRHPSYSEALPFLLEGKFDTAEARQKPNTVIEGFAKVLLKLVSKWTAHKIRLDDLEESDLTKTVIDYFDKLPQKTRDEILLKLADSGRAGFHLSMGVVTGHFDNLPPELMSQLLVKLVDSSYAGAIQVAYKLILDFDKLPQKTRDEILLKLADELANNWTASEVVTSIGELVIIVIADRFNKLPQKTRDEILLKLADSENTARFVAYTLAHSFGNLSRKTRRQLSRLTNGGIGAVYDNDFKFDKLPQKTRDEILLKLADNDKAADLIVAMMDISTIIDKLPQKTKDQLIFKLNRRGFKT